MTGLAHATSQRQILIPEEAWKALNLRGGESFDISVRRDGCIELHPMAMGTVEELISLGQRLTQGADIVVHPEGFDAGLEADFKRSVGQ